MKISIDSNIFISDFKLRSTRVSIFFDSLNSIPATLHIPEVVIDETVNKYKELLTAKVKSIEQSLKDLNKDLDITRKIPEIKVNGEVHNYREFLIETLKKYNTEIIAYPEVSHKKVVERIFEKKHPFKSGEKGYRDYLIWESIKKLSLWGHEKVVFITNNTHDFGEGKFISEDYSDLFSHSSNFELFTSIEKFNDQYVIPRLKKLDLVKEKLTKHKINSFDFSSWLEKNLVDRLRDFELEDVLLGFPQGVGQIWVTGISLYQDQRIENVMELKSGDFLLSYEVVCNVDASVDIAWEDYVENKEVQEYLGYESEPFSFSSGYTSECLTIKGELILNKTSLEVESDVIKLIKGPYETIKFK